MAKTNSKHLHVIYYCAQFNSQHSWFNPSLVNLSEYNGETIQNGAEN